MNADSQSAVLPGTRQPTGLGDHRQSGWAITRAVVSGPCIGLLVLAAMMAGMRLGVRGVVVPDMLSTMLTQLLLVNLASGLVIGVVVGVLQARYHQSPPLGTVPLIVIVAFCISIGTVAICCTPSAAGEVNGHILSQRMLQATISVYGAALLFVVVVGGIARRAKTAAHESRTTEPTDAADSR